MSRTLQKVTLSVLGLVASAGFTVATQAPAHANRGDCTSYIRSKGHIVSQAHIDVCRRTELNEGKAGNYVSCILDLNRLTPGGMREGEAAEACRRAMW
jgi:hypothetical protein